MLLKSIKKERVEFRLEVFFESSLNDAGISFQISAPTLKKALFWNSIKPRFLNIKFIC